VRQVAAFLPAIALRDSMISLRFHERGYGLYQKQLKTGREMVMGKHGKTIPTWKT